MKKIFAIMFAAAILAGCSDETTTPRFEYDNLTFENVDAKYLAGPDTPYGENLYGAAAGEQYTGYTDAATGLRMEINAGEYGLSNGGIAISQWNYMTDDAENNVTANNFANQCSVYFKAPNGFGGHNGSRTFGIVYYSSWAESSSPALYFEDGETERVFDHFWVTNSAHAALTMKDGGTQGAKALTFADKDWFLLTITGYDKTGTKTREVKFYLADFSTSGAGGIITEWTKVNLASLGAVNKLEFVLSGSDSGEWGINTPAYFCFDDVVIRR